MKSTLLGMVVLIGVVGGSVGLYYAHPEWTASTPTPEPEQAATAASDTPPTPIPLVERPQDAPSTPSNPFAKRREPQTVDVAADRYADTTRKPAADANQSPAEIPDASEVVSGGEQMPATASADPFGLRERTAEPASRYAEQPASAETSDEDTADQPAEADAALDEPTPAAAEPRRLTTPAAENVDRYGRPLAMEKSASRAPKLADRPADEPRQEPPSSSETDDVAADTTTDAAADAVDGTGRPGDPNLSGSQAPTLTIEKSAPPEIQIGKPAKFVIKVRNAGSVTAHGVEIHDSVPQGTQLIDATPAAKRGPQGTLVWDLGSIKPGEEQTAQLQLMPMNEGEIGSVATVHFRAEASVRTVATRPLLNVEVFAPSKVMKGEEVTLKIRLSNPGSGAATGVMLNEAVPEGLKHAGGHELEFEVGTLKPGETRELELGLVADAAGQVTNTIVATADANLEVEAKTEIEVIAPQLQVTMSGPKRRYLERNATHNISVTNPGTAAAKDIELAAALPRELKFVEANNGGQYDAATHSVYWSLEELPPQETGTVTLVTLPQQPGEAKLTIKSTAQAGLADQRDEVLSIEGLAAINFQLTDANDPIEVNGQTTYEVRVTNQGTKSASGVRLVAVVPREMKPISAEGPVRYKIDGQRIVFDPLKQLAPKADTAYTIKVKALEPGDVRLQVQVSTDDIREPVSKEESTRVFGDE
jgi:uncharacterized repeat protein (TIGR01451 family)